MTKKIEKKQIVKNISISLFAQLLSLLVSFILSMVVPKYLEIYQYAYWHTFLLYVSYVGVLHFGLLDGLILRYSQYDYEELDKIRIRSQFVVLLGISFVASIILVIFGLVNGGLTETLSLLVAFGVLTKNIFTYNSYLFQITNRINKYVLVVIVQRLTYGIVVVLLLVFNQQYFIWYCIADLLGDFAGICLSLFSNRELHFGKVLKLKDNFEETWLNISSGFLLMLSNWSSMLLIGSAKIIVEWKWGALIFGKTSFAFSMTNLFLTFVAAISIVLFPSLKRMEQDTLPSFYKQFRDMLTPFLFWCLILYYPESWLLEKWLPKYVSSLSCLGLLNPLIVYSSIISLLTNNYLKAFRKEMVLLVINVLTVLLAIGLYIMSAYWFENFFLLLIAVVLVVILRTIFSEIAVMKIIHLDLKKEFLIEFLLTCAFLISTQCFTKIAGFFFYLTFMIVYTYINLNSIISIKRTVLNILHIRKG